MIELIIYSRSYCHLCDDMRDALMAHAGNVEFMLEVVDVDADPLLVTRYDELVPVLAARMPDGTVRVLCHYFLDKLALLAFFSEENHKTRTETDA